ncbi:hypothetical protein [Microseira wollei]|uniref:Uncharacterized protein n=1 Tax=Microseira wollei NIES-4236 TaxID=2530354 RepID=A0AAV3WKZ9_9CYAN|nr:hypothetical protein [Microseira wollei]GET41439.1 hypothetical protein MiSe_62510 [Microseira wollei NIES-4236]
MELYSVRILRTEEERILAKRLLYEVYVQEQGWIPPVGNPSNLKIAESVLGNILVDDYDSVSTQFGGFYGDRLVGVHRIITRFNGRLEVENYSQLPRFLQNDCHHELSRSAVDINFRKSPIFLLIVATEIRYLIGCGCKYAIGTATFPEPGNFFCKIGATRINFPEFKYYLLDQNLVSLIVLFLEQPENFRRLFTVVDKFKQKGKVKLIGDEIDL